MITDLHSDKILQNLHKARKGNDCGYIHSDGCRKEWRPENGEG